MTFTLDDHRHMARALRIAARGLYSTHPNPRVGCVIVRDGEAVAEGWHVRAGEAHAEINALERAGASARGATLYVTLEPCRHTGRTPPCTGAIRAAGVARVIAAMRDPNPRVAGKGLEELAGAGIATECGLMSDEAHALNEGFVSRMRRRRPFVRLKMAMSLDGRTAMASGESQSITGAAARRDVQHWRASSDAVVNGIGTVLGDDPRLDVRPPERGEHRAPLGNPPRQPLRVIMDSSLRTPPSARTLDPPGQVLIATALAVDRAPDALARRAEILTLASEAGRPSPAALLTSLAAREINEVLIEAGPGLAGAFTAAALVDEFLIYAAPTLLGSGARPLLDLPGIERMADQIRLRLNEVSVVGDDLRIRARPAGTG